MDNTSQMSKANRTVLATWAATFELQNGPKAINHTITLDTIIRLLVASAAVVASPEPPIRRNERSRQQSSKFVVIWSQIQTDQTKRVHGICKVCSTNQNHQLSTSLSHCAQSCTSLWVWGTGREAVRVRSWIPYSFTVVRCCRRLQ